MDLDRNLCYCFHISKRKIVNFVRRTRPKYASQIAECFGAGTGCGWCIPFLCRIHREIIAGNEDVATEDIGTADFEAMRDAYIAGVRDGSRERNRIEASARPVSAEPPSESPTAAPREVSRPSAAAESDHDDDWDVSDYFSRPARSDPEPETLDDESGER
jgi:bacterioferritin-associated ferredoxin